MSEHVEMICEGCDVRVVDEEPKVDIAQFLRAAVAEGWRDIGEQENIPAVMSAVGRAHSFSLLVLFDALCPVCVSRIKAKIAVTGARTSFQKVRP
jgi:hypothetical protein